MSPFIIHQIFFAGAIGLNTSRDAAKTGEYLKDNNHNSSKLTVCLELHSRKTVLFLEQITSADKYTCIFSRQMEAIVYIMVHTKRLRPKVIPF